MVSSLSEAYARCIHTFHNQFFWMRIKKRKAISPRKMPWVRPVCWAAGDWLLLFVILWTVINFVWVIVCFGFDEKRYLLSSWINDWKWLTLNFTKTHHISGIPSSCLARVCIRRKTISFRRVTFQDTYVHFVHTELTRESHTMCPQNLGVKVSWQIEPKVDSKCCHFFVNSSSFYLSCLVARI